MLRVGWMYRRDGDGLKGNGRWCCRSELSGESEWEWSGFWWRDQFWDTPPCLGEYFPSLYTLNLFLLYTQTIRTQCLEKNRAALCKKEAGKAVIFLMKLEQRGVQAVFSVTDWHLLNWRLHVDFATKACPPIGWWAAEDGTVTTLYFYQLIN